MTNMAGAEGTAEETGVETGAEATKNGIRTKDGVTAKIPSAQGTCHPLIILVE